MQRLGRGRPIVASRHLCGLMPTQTSPGGSEPWRVCRDLEGLPARGAQGERVRVGDLATAEGTGHGASSSSAQISTLASRKAIVDGRRQTSPGAAMRPTEIPEIRRVDPDTEWDEEYWDGFVEDYSRPNGSRSAANPVGKSCITRSSPWSRR